MALEINFYKDGDVFIFRDTVVPAASLTVRDRGEGIVAIRRLNSDVQFIGPIENVKKKNGDAYANFAALITALDGFFDPGIVDVKTALGIDSTTGSEGKVLSEKGTFVNLPEETDVDEALGIDRADGDESKVLSEKGTFVNLPEETDVDEALGIDRADGDESKVLSEKGTFVNLPEEV